MPIPSERIRYYETVRNFGDIDAAFPISGLTNIQTDSYTRLLQRDVAPRDRKDFGIEEVLREIFPVESYDGTYRLEYVKYELGKPRYNQTECRQLRLTYGRPLRVWMRLVKEQPVEEEVYLGDLPIMIGGGEFIVNGAERCVVSQLHRSPGVDFVPGGDTNDTNDFTCRIIPERGSWVEMVISKKGVLQVRIDQSGKFSVLTLLRAMDEKYGTAKALVDLFFETETVPVDQTEEFVKTVTGKTAADDLIYPADSERSGEIMAETGHVISETVAKELQESGLSELLLTKHVEDPLLMTTLLDDTTNSHEEALLRIYQRLRPGNPPALEKAKDLFAEKFHDVNRYRLGRVGRFRINRKFDQDLPDTEMTLRVEDLISAINYILDLRAGRNEARVDDIDNLGNRRLRTIDELGADEIRKGFLKLRRTVQERMSLKDVEEMTPRTLVNPKSVSAAIDYFFGRSELSQVVDQTNPLSTLTHERRLSALGPGGLNRKRAGFEVRDVHFSHYGRICPIETPEGTNIGLISSLGMYAKVDDYGFLITPYRKVEDGTITDAVDWLRADEEVKYHITPADTLVKDGRIEEGRVLARYSNDTEWIPAEQVQYMDVSTSQMIGVSAGLIPFLEHDDANRALMGSNMQRQAVPLLIAEPPLVGTGLERDVAQNSGMVLKAEKAGTVTAADADHVEIDGVRYPMRKFTGLNERTCMTQKPIVKPGDKVKAGQILCDSAATRHGELALGRNVTVAFMSWSGYNFEDAIILSERLVKEDVYTSIHIDEYDVEIRETKLGKEEFTNDIPNVSEKALRHLNDEGIVEVGTRVSPGDVLVGKVSPKAKAELTPEEKLLHAIFGRAGEDVKNESLDVPSGVEGIVIQTEKFSRKMSLSDVEKKAYEEDLKKTEAAGDETAAAVFRDFLKDYEAALGAPLEDDDGRAVSGVKDDAFVVEYARRFPERIENLDVRSPQKKQELRKVFEAGWPKVEEAIDERDHAINRKKLGDELGNGVLQMVKVYVASKRQISVGDKMAGRHGNKGVISKILPVEDMPYLEDGTPVDIILNPLGVPSRMNVGQILETHLGWAANVTGFRAICPVFDGADEEQIKECMREAGLPEDGKAQLYDGRTGEPFEQKTTVGQIYMLKLHHLVDDKVHARATGPYSLITQQPLGGKARFGGQRFGEMEVWALEAYGAAYVLQELLTVKSDDVEGRTKIYESMVKGENTLEAGTPASFDVLLNEIRGLCLNMQLEKSAV